jgi:hypothetical protein
MSNQRYLRGKKESLAADIRRKKNGRYIDVWESEAMKHLFVTLRNPRSHGSRSARRPKTHEQQRAWTIESCMS